MSYKTGTVTFTTTGVKTITTPGWTPKGIRLFVGSAAGGVDTYVHFCQGRADGTNQNVNYQYADGVIFESDNSSSKVISQWEDGGAGSLVEVLAADFNSFNSGNFKLNCSIANSGYQIFFEAWD